MSAMPAFMLLKYSLPSAYILHSIIYPYQFGWEENMERTENGKSTKLNIIAKYRSQI